MYPLRQGITIRSTHPLDQYKPSVQEKQLGLNSLAEMLRSLPLQACHHTLMTGLADYQVGNDDQDQVHDLFINRSSLFAKTCTRSGSLALAAFAFKVFGQSLLDDSMRHMDPDKLTMALHMLFGKAMPSIQADLIRDVAIAQLVDGSEFSLINGGYKIHVSPIENAGQRQHAIDTFVTARNVNGRYFRTKTAAAVHNVLATGTDIPAVISAHLPTASLDPKSDLQRLYSSGIQTVLASGVTITSTMTLRYPLVDYLPSSSSDTNLGTEEYLTASPYKAGTVPAWLLRLDRRFGEVLTSSQICAIATQKNSSPADRISTAAQVVQEIFPPVSDTVPDSDEPRLEAPRRQPVLVDIRLLSAPHERASHLKHVAAMHTACKESVQKVTYVPLFQATHSASIPASLRNKPTPAELFYPVPIGSRQSANEKLTRLIEENFAALPEPVQRRYKSVCDTTVKLIATPQLRINAIPLATFLSILFGVFNQHASDTTPEFALCMGCESATGRTASVLTGVAMLEPLVLFGMASTPDVVISDELFLVRPHSVELDYPALGAERALLLADLYDPSLLAVTADRSSDEALEPDDQPLKEYFSALPFVTDTAY